MRFLANFKIQLLFVLCCLGSYEVGASENDQAVKISMKAEDWDILYSPGLGKHPTAINRHAWFFDFPNITRGHMHYLVQNVRGAILDSEDATMRADIRISTRNSPIFEYHTETANICDFPAHARFYIEQKFNNANYVRWWAAARAVELAPGIYRYVAPLDPREWSDTYGHSAAMNTAAKAGFRKTLRNPKRIGLTFGGGCFYGHGVGMRGGSARFEVSHFSVN